MKARRTAENNEKASQGVPIELFFPLTFLGMVRIWSELLIPLMIPLFTECGLLLLGQPGVGEAGKMCTREADPHEHQTAA